MFSKELYKQFCKKYLKWKLLLVLIILISLVALCIVTVKQDLSTNENLGVPLAVFCIGFAAFVILLILQTYIEGCEDCFKRSYVSKHSDGSISYKEVLSVDGVRLIYATYYSNRIDRVVKDKYLYLIEGSFDYDYNGLDSGYIQKLKIPIVFENMEELLKCVE